MNKFVFACFKRCLWTMAEVAVAMLETKALVTDVDWLTLINAVTMAGIVSLLKSFTVGVPEEPKDV